MTIRLLAGFLIGVLIASFCGVVNAQDWPEFPPLDPENPHAFARGPGAYLAWWKLLLIAATFLPWVALADWMNVDCQRYFQRTRIPATMWNLLVVGVFLLGFLFAISFPWFLIGFPLYVLAAFAPFTAYVILRNSRMPEHQAVFTTGHLSRTLKGERPLVDQAIADEEGPPVQLEASGTAQQAQVNQIRARQASNLVILKSLFYDAMVSRADQVAALRSAQAVQWRKRIDGVWHPLPTMDREIGEAALASIRLLSNIDPGDRSPASKGHFTIRTDSGPIRCETSQLAQDHGETVQLRLLEPKKQTLALGDLGMFPEAVESFRECLNSPGLIIVSAFPGAGLSTSWHSILLATDRVTRDWVGILDHDELETRVENIEVTRYDSRQNQTPLEHLRSLLLKQPEAFVLPKISDAATMDAMTQQVLKEGRTVVTRCVARSAAEALLRMMQIAGQRRDFIDAVTAVTGQRLARRLCDQCKQPMPFTPDLIKKMGGDPANPPSLFKQYAKPDPPPVDKKGRPIEIPPCKKCAGIGYYGRVGLIELIRVDDAIRKALAQQPDVTTITNLALNKRHQSALQQGYRHVLAGTTSVAEIQRIFKESE